MGGYKHTSGYHWSAAGKASAARKFAADKRNPAYERKMRAIGRRAGAAARGSTWHK